MSLPSDEFDSEIFSYLEETIEFQLNMNFENNDIMNEIEEIKYCVGQFFFNCR